MYKVVLLRHGESTWNRENRFTGWTDVGLSEKGVQSCEVVGVDGTAADMTAEARGMSPRRPTWTPVCCGCPSHCLPVRFHGIRRQGPGAWPGAPNVVTTTPHQLLRTSRRRPPVPSPHVICSCEAVLEQPACHSGCRGSG